MELAMSVDRMEIGGKNPARREKVLIEIALFFLATLDEKLNGLIGVSAIHRYLLLPATVADYCGLNPNAIQRNRLDCIYATHLEACVTLIDGVMLQTILTQQSNIRLCKIKCAMCGLPQQPT